MKRALSLARRARGRTAPNPPVGAVLVRGGRSVGAGLHTRTGSDHAEVRALDAAGRAADATGLGRSGELTPTEHKHAGLDMEKLGLRDALGKAAEQRMYRHSPSVLRARPVAA